MTDFGEVLADCSREECGEKQVVVAHVTGFLNRDRFHVSRCCNSERDRSSRPPRLDSGNCQRSLYGNHVVLVVHQHILGLRLSIGSGTVEAIKKKAECLQPLDPRLLLVLEAYLQDRDQAERYEAIASIEAQYARSKELVERFRKRTGKARADWQDWSKDEGQKDSGWKETEWNDWRDWEDTGPATGDPARSPINPAVVDDWVDQLESAGRVTTVAPRQKHMGRLDKQGTLVPKVSAGAPVVPRREWDQSQCGDEGASTARSRRSRSPTVTWSASEPISRPDLTTPTCFRCQRPGQLVHCCVGPNRKTRQERSRLIVLCCRCISTLRGLCWG